MLKFLFHMLASETFKTTNVANKYQKLPQKTLQFNNVSLFYNCLSSLLRTCKLSFNDIWNIDETGTGTVQKPVKIIAEKRGKGSWEDNSGKALTIVFGGGGMH